MKEFMKVAEKKIVCSDTAPRNILFIEAAVNDGPVYNH